jgi:hypothetical protein
VQDSNYFPAVTRGYLLQAPNEVRLAEDQEGEEAEDRTDGDAAEPEETLADVALYDGAHIVGWITEAEADALREAGQIMCEPTDMPDPMHLWGAGTWTGSQGDGPVPGREQL